LDNFKGDISNSGRMVDRRALNPRIIHAHFLLGRLEISLYNTPEKQSNNTRGWMDTLDSRILAESRDSVKRVTCTDWSGSEARALTVASMAEYDWINQVHRSSNRASLMSSFI
jgi:hypothetical protein